MGPLLRLIAFISACVLISNRVRSSATFKHFFAVMSDEEMRKRFPLTLPPPAQPPAHIEPRTLYTWAAVAVFVTACLLSAALRL
jgi:hypothetical protein